MSTGKLLLYALGLLLAFVILSVVVNVLLTLIGLTLWLVRMLITLAVILGVAYALYRLYGVLAGESTKRKTSSYSMESTESYTSDSVSTGSSGVDTLQQQYLNGEISEAEFERRLERELDTESERI